MGTEMHILIGIHVKCLLFLSDFNQNWNGSKNVNKTH
jgi:hypothetical protein